MIATFDLIKVTGKDGDSFNSQPQDKNSWELISHCCKSSIFKHAVV